MGHYILCALVGLAMLVGTLAVVAGLIVAVAWIASRLPEPGIWLQRIFVGLFVAVCVGAILFTSVQIGCGALGYGS